MTLLIAITIFALLWGVLAGVFGGLLAAVLAFVAGWIIGLLLVLLFLVAVWLLVDMEKEQTEDSKFHRTLAHLYIDLALILGRVEVRTQGLEKLPTDGRFLLVSNHICDLDSALLLKCFPKSQLCFIGKQEIKTMPVVGAMMHKMMCQFINRENDREALKTILRCIQIIKDDQASIVVFPEGYVSMDGRLRHFRSGALKIAQKPGVPIVVCTVRNTKHVMQDLFALRKTWAQVHLVEVLDAETVTSMPTTELAEKIYEIMISDLGEQYRTDEKAMHPDLQTCADPIE
jgi:1-acyl-sn-glycerol-3-phosphate acyltransferase